LKNKNGDGEKQEKISLEGCGCEIDPVSAEIECTVHDVEQLQAIMKNLPKKIKFKFGEALESPKEKEEKKEKE
jgi:hypothetical protein